MLRGKFMNSKFVSFIIALALSSCIIKNDNTSVHAKRSDFYAKGSLDGDAVEAEIDFDFKISIAKDDFRDLNSENEINDIVTKKINKQISHLFGSFKSSNYKGIPKLGSSQKIVFNYKNMKLDEENSLYTINYHYNGIAMIEQNVGESIKLPLPINPDQIYVQSKGMNGMTPCADQHYNSEGDFWYFWNIHLEECTTLELGTEYDFVDIALKKKPNTKTSYPDYNRLIDKSINKNEPTLKIYAFFGTADEIKALDDELNNSSEIKFSFRQTMKYLKMLDFENITKENLSPVSKLYRFKKTISEKKVTIEITLFVGNTGIDEKSVSEFHKIYKEALENGAVIYYGGHSGLGANLKVANIESSAGPVNIPKNKYQILIFDSCSSYPYYTEKYFNKKIGVKKPDGSVDEIGSYNFDIITNGLESYFTRNSITFNVFLESIMRAYLTNAYDSYQKILTRIHKIHLKNDTSVKGHLISISGDEDNPNQ